MLQKPEVERAEHQNDSDIYRQPFPEVVPEEQKVNANHDHNQREHIQHGDGLSSHASFYSAHRSGSKSCSGSRAAILVLSPDGMRTFAPVI